MGAFASRQNNAIEEAENVSNNAYKYPPRTGNFFGSHFIMGGERFDSTSPESYLFGENADLNFLGGKPTAFPYPPPQSNEPTKTLKSLVNIRKESVRFVKVLKLHQEKLHHDKTDGVAAKVMEIKESVASAEGNEQVDGNVLGSCIAVQPPTCSYNIEFTFDSDVKCAITIYYFCTEEVSPSGVTLLPRDGLSSETYHYEKGINQYFNQPTHVFNPNLIPEDDFVYNSTKEIYPVAIHMISLEGNEECRQSHTTVCVIDHHPESNSYVLRALKQKIFVDGLCYLLQEIYGIENKAINKSSLDEEIDDHGSEECVICMSETRDTLILPCRHLCLCNSCADSLRYQANNCPICRAPFRALLQIRAVQKGVAPHTLHQNTPTSAGGAETLPCEHVPAGYIPVSLIEALNGPPQYVGRARNTDGDITDGVNTIAGENHKATSPHKRRSKNKKNVVSTATNTNSTDTALSNNTVGNKETATATDLGSNTTNKISPNSEKADKRLPQDKLQIVNERNSLKLPKTKRNSSGQLCATTNINDDDEEDSENEKLSPLLSPGSKSQQSMHQAHLIKRSSMNEVAAVPIINSDIDEDVEDNCPNAAAVVGNKKEINNSSHALSSAAVQIKDIDKRNEEDSDYFTPEDPHNSILSPLCPDKMGKSSTSTDKLGSLKNSAAGSFKGAGNLTKKNLHKKSTSVGNIIGSGASSNNDMKGNNVSSLPDMLDSPNISGGGNSASTRSSSDSYSSSSSTKQLLSSNPVHTAANIIVDDKTALQNAVNV